MAAVTIYWYGPERPASRRCLVRCAALLAGEPLVGAEERWPVQESEKGKPFSAFTRNPLFRHPQRGLLARRFFQRADRH